MYLLEYPENESWKCFLNVGNKSPITNHCSVYQARCHGCRLQTLFLFQRPKWMPLSGFERRDNGCASRRGKSVSISRYAFYINNRSPKSGLRLSEHETRWHYKFRKRQERKKKKWDSETATHKVHMSQLCQAMSPSLSFSLSRSPASADMIAEQESALLPNCSRL